MNDLLAEWLTRPVGHDEGTQRAPVRTEPGRKEVRWAKRRMKQKEKRRSGTVALLSETAPVMPTRVHRRRGQKVDRVHG